MLTTNKHLCQQSDIQSHLYKSWQYIPIWLLQKTSCSKIKSWISHPTPGTIQNKIWRPVEDSIGTKKIIHLSKFSNGFSKRDSITGTIWLKVTEDFTPQRYSICCGISSDVGSIGIVRNTRTFTEKIIQQP